MAEEQAMKERKKKKRVPAGNYTHSNNFQPGKGKFFFLNSFPTRGRVWPQRVPISHIMQRKKKVFVCRGPLYST